MSVIHPPDALFWLWLQLRLGAGSRLMMTIAEQEGGARWVYESSPDRLWDTGLFSVKTINALNDRDLASAERILQRCTELGISAATPSSENYPRQLLSLPDLPAVLFYKGDLMSMCSRPCVALVGTRGATDYGMNAAAELAERLSRAGMTVVSGCARGIDTAAHTGALRALGGATVAVLGCGIDYRYNMANEKLRGEIADRGALVSEYPPGTDSSPHRFPLRNRIISGLSLGTIVIEADIDSGSLITARMAAEQGRDVFAMPTAPGMPKSSGVYALLREDGAQPVYSPLDVLKGYAHMYPMHISLSGAERPLMLGREPERMPEAAESESVTEAQSASSRRKKQADDYSPNVVDDISSAAPSGAVTDGLSDGAMAVFRVLRAGPLLLDELADQAGFTTSETMDLLMELELSGLAKACPGSRYSLA